MLYDAIQLGSQVFHEQEPLGSFYDTYLDSPQRKLWRTNGEFSETDARALITFVNQWRTRYQSTPMELASALTQVSSLLRALERLDFFTAELDLPILPRGASVADVVQVVFDTLACCGRRFEATGTSKILHTLNPEFFLMWDDRIRTAYGVRDGDGHGYSHVFLGRVQRLVRKAVREVAAVRGVSAEQAVASLCRCAPHGLAKVVDEYNYAKFTLGAAALWDAELQSNVSR